MIERPGRYDYVIIFGAAVRPDGTPSGTLRRRVEEAVRAGARRGPVRFLVTGGLVRHPPAEADVMRRLLLERGVPDANIVVEDSALNTLQSAIRCAALLRARNDVGEIVVCTSRYHVHRCRMLLGLNGVRTADAVVSQDAPRVGRLRYAYAWMRELAALPLDAALMSTRRLWDIAGPARGDRE